MQVNKKRWIVDPPDWQRQSSLADASGISPVLAQICLNRGLSTPQQIADFLACNEEKLADPFLFPEMEKAVREIAGALKHNEKILIYGDYDVDGITATSLLYLYLSGIGGNVAYYIPDRMEEGYGLNDEAVSWAKESGFNLIITVDCGISAVSQVELAKRLGMRVIVTDHHQPRQDLPKPLALINPKLPGCPYPDADLAGVGVAWKLAQAVEMRLFDRKAGTGVLLAEFLDLVSLGTVADVVSLTGENRIIVKKGLTAFNGPGLREGLKALLAEAGWNGKQVSETQLGFLLAPRLNAAGRLASARDGVELLIDNDPSRCRDIARTLNQENSERQAVEKAIFEEVLKMVESPEKKDKRILLLASPGWHPGVIGIVASRLVERFYRPAILLSIEGDTAKGSGRSIPGFDISVALENCQELLLQFGGHKQAAGLKLEARFIDQLEERLNRLADDTLSEWDLLPVLKADVDRGIDGTEKSIADSLEALAPFGQGNPSPLFVLRDLSVVEVRTVGAASAHLKLKVRSGGRFLDAIAFNAGRQSEWLIPGVRVDLACTLENNRWNGRETLQLVLRDIRPAGALTEWAKVPAAKLLDMQKTLSGDSWTRLPGPGEKMIAAFTADQGRLLWQEKACQVSCQGKKTVYICSDPSRLYFEHTLAELEMSRHGLSVFREDFYWSPDEKKQALDAFHQGNIFVWMTTPEMLFGCLEEMDSEKIGLIVLDLSQPLVLPGPEDDRICQLTRHFPCSGFLILTLPGEEKYLRTLGDLFQCTNISAGKEPGLPEIIDCRGQNPGWSYLEAILCSKESCLAYVQSQKRAEELLSWIRSFDCGFSEAVLGCWGSLRPWQLAHISRRAAAGTVKLVVTDQPLPMINGFNFDHVVLFDCPPNFADFCNLTGLTASGDQPKVHLAYHSKLPREYCNENWFPDRENLGEIYRLIRELSSRQSEPLTPGKILFHCKLDETVVSAAVSIFQELGLIREVEKDCCRVVELVEEKLKVSLEDSRIFRMGQKEKEAHTLWRKMAFISDFTEQVKKICHK